MARPTAALAGCLAVVLVATGCASLPTGPSVTVLPGTGRPFDQFQADDASCRGFASQQIGGTTTTQAGADNVASGAAVGTLLGAAAGAAIGAVAGNPGLGAAAGAGFGLFSGTAVGSGNAQVAQVSVQRRYDAAYVQCMYAKGHQVPVARGSQQPYTHGAAAAPAAGSPPPPPPATGPPPPPPPAGAPPPPPGSWTR
jgi:hypothetical protein